jgi:hypothetical protein
MCKSVKQQNLFFFTTKVLSHMLYTYISISEICMENMTSDKHEHRVEMAQHRVQWWPFVTMVMKNMQFTS